MNEQIKRYIKKVIRRGTLFLIVGVFSSFTTYYLNFTSDRLLPLIFLSIGVSSVLAGYYLKVKNKDRIEAPSFEAINIMTEMPSNIWIGIVIAESAIFLIMYEFFKISHVIAYAYIAFVITYILWFFLQVRKLNKSLAN